MIASPAIIRSRPVTPIWPSPIYFRRPFPTSGNLVEWNNVSPRLGIASDVTGHGKSVVRASYGRY